MSIKRVYFGDYIFNISDRVYEPAEDSFLFAENLAVNEEETVLDMGTGCGLLGIVAAEKTRRVVAIDINPYAVHCARENAKLNKMQHKISYIQGDLFAPLSDNFKFDVALFNAPYIPTDENETESWIEYAWMGGVEGRQVIDRFVDEAPHHIKQSGRILLMQSTLTDIDVTFNRFAAYGMRTRVVAELALPFFETIKLVEARI